MRYGHRRFFSNDSLHLFVQSFLVCRTVSSSVRASLSTHDTFPAPVYAVSGDLLHAEDVLRTIGSLVFDLPNSREVGEDTFIWHCCFCSFFCCGFVLVRVLVVILVLVVGVVVAVVADVIAVFVVVTFNLQSLFDLSAWVNFRAT